MLTKTDLSQIRKVVREEVKVEIKDSTHTLDHQIRMSRIQVQQDISGIDDRMKNVEIRLDNVEGEVKKMGKDVKGIKKTVDVMLDVLDQENVNLRKRVEKIEDHLGFVSS